MKFDAHGNGGTVSGPLVTAGPIAPSDLTCTTGPGSASNNLSSVNIQGIASLSGISTSASGATDAGGLQTSAAQASVGKLNLLDGLVTADGVSANANATDDATGKVSTTGNVTLTNVKVAGAAVTSTAPNTTINLLIGTVVVNEQTSTAAGGGIAVNALHIKLFGGAVDVVVGHAAAALVPVGSACPAP
ncbi:choice-of-anchor P family protein [Kitasatospora camelliae]|uniref:Choice-of-anchor P family protein n=1 Tax=Kitasatospora camelliae TaxID=3156397 RepID=A0AAU8JY77_9ACTN